MAVNSPTECIWTNLNSHPKTLIVGVPFGIDKYNYIVLDKDNVYKYNFHSNRWTKTTDIPNTVSISDESCHSAFDSNKHDLWLFNNIAVAHNKLNRNNHWDITYKDKDTGVPGQSIVINNMFHIISGGENNSILRWNESDKQFENITKIYNDSKLSLFGLVHNKLNNCLLLFGGYDYFRYKFMDCILEYNIGENKWHRLPVSLPKPIWRCVCTMAIRNTYVLIFGGNNGIRNYSDDDNNIVIYSLKEKTVQISETKCPSNETFVSALTVSDENKDEKIVFGFVRNYWKDSQIEDHYFPPYYLLKLMQRFYLNEFVYLLGRYQYEGHWKISTLDIV